MQLKRKMIRLLLPLLIALTMLSGCARPLIIHPIEKSDIFVINKGDKITNAEGEVIIVEKKGRFLSEFYIKEIVKARTNQ